MRGFGADRGGLPQGTKFPDCPPPGSWADGIFKMARRLGERLQACRQIRRLANHRFVPRRTSADEVAHDHLPTGYADPGL
jgi:hypothetical protein